MNNQGNMLIIGLIIIAILAVAAFFVSQRELANDKAADQAEEMLEETKSEGTSSPTTSNGSSAVPLRTVVPTPPAETVEKNVVRYTQNGFVPFTVEVIQGTELIFRNETANALQVTTRNHPTAIDQEYPGFTESETIYQGEEWGVVLLKEGAFGYKHKFNDDLGAIVVLPQN